MRALFHARVESYVDELLTTRGDILDVLYEKYAKLRDPNVVFLVNMDDDELYFQPTQVLKDDETLYPYIPWNLRNNMETDVIVLFCSFEARTVRPYAFLKPMKECVVYFSP